MIKKLARHILKNELKRDGDLFDKVLNAHLKTSEELKRLEKVLNEMEKVERQIREYSFSPGTMEADDIEIIGRMGDSPLVSLISKWFKAKADQNNDMLIHNVDATDEKKSLWRIAVLVYEDWYMFIKNCQQMADKAKKKEDKKVK